MKPILALILLALAVMELPAAPAHAQMELTEVDPPDGARLEVPADQVHLCFSERVNVADDGGWEFGYVVPDGRRLGLRIVFQPDGECVDVFPGLPDERPAGEYTFEWKVVAAEGGEEGSGTLHFQVTKSSAATPAASPAPRATASPEASPGPGDGDGAPDIVQVALLTIAGAGGAAVLLTLGYLIRRRIGYEPHRPARDGEEGEESEGH